MKPNSPVVAFDPSGDEHDAATDGPDVAASFNPVTGKDSSPTMFTLAPEQRVTPKPPRAPDSLSVTCGEIQSLYRRWVFILSAREKLARHLHSFMAGTLGYCSGLEDDDRKSKFAEAAEIIKQVAAGDADHDFKDIITNTSKAIALFDAQKQIHESDMEQLAKQLPAFAWINLPDRRGFGVHTLAKIIGETGDLRNYANPAKVWKRMGCAPHSFGGLTLMGSTWRAGKEGKLPADEWQKYGYCPRRRSLAYLIGEGIVKQNGEGPYRTHYDVKKAHFLANRPEWTRCGKCEGAGKVKGVGKRKEKDCTNCKGSGKVAKRCHLTAMLCATKLLLKELWVEWNK